MATIHLVRRKPVQCSPLRPGMKQLLDALIDVPAYVMGREMDILGWNTLATSLYGDFGDMTPRQRNWARITFLDPRAHDLFPDWDHKALEVVHHLRTQMACAPHDSQLITLVDELSAESRDFHLIWSRGTGREMIRGPKRIHHPLVGDLTLWFEVLAPANDPHQFLITCHAAPDSPSAELLRLLASWGG
ncbi:MmyB family transcriptional regulator [Streptomyces hawaiiensis]|uniref:MmyB family transcriptional regulator n=1 Tax=Streptomyces hawaiiensis TaxID=67305 RepID=UPI00364D603D